MEFILIGGAAFIAGALFGGWRVQRSWQGQQRLWEITRSNLEREKREAYIRYLETLLREVANLLIAESPSNMERLYMKAKRREREATESLERAEAERTALAHKYPYFEKFDIVGAKHFVPYSQATSWNTIDDLEEVYLDISQWIAIEFFRQTSGKLKLFDDEDAKVLDRVLTREKDTKLYHRIENAMALYYRFSSNVEEGSSEGFEFPNFSVTRGYRPNSPEVEYWITFKNPDEWAIYSVFSDGAKTYKSYHRASHDFQRMTALDCDKTATPRGMC
ncbi:hypothetical protein ATU3C_12560 [Agrobacterium genomosp. 3 str. RTP8]|uniref:hypothetical protein n=1 Tax=Agrobacterium tomkonis TaxID=1183410 RepID=UPI001CD95B18|nr:hypothetical protein [Agrobacterium tomkonis RTP8]